MKKKFRKIVIDGDDSWAWRFYAKGDYYDWKSVTIWKDRKVVYENSFSPSYSVTKKKRYKFTPGLIARFIKIYLRNDNTTNKG